MPEVNSSHEEKLGVLIPISVPHTLLLIANIQAKKNCLVDEGQVCNPGCLGSIHGCATDVLCDFIPLLQNMGNSASFICCE